MTNPLPTANDTVSDALLEQVREGIVGDHHFIQTPFGKRKLTYADYTASGRSLDFIEQTLLEHVLPLYANTHTEATATGMQTSRFREDARAIIRSAVNANEDDLVIFCGSGATAAVSKLINMLNLPSASESTNPRPVVFIGPYEHHSNELPWREAKLEVVRIAENPAGGVDLQALEQALLTHKDNPIKIGSFSAASNVTGIRADQDAITTLLHQHNALSFWDFAAAAPYVAIDMNPEDNNPDSDAGNSLAHKDAIFLSCHKFIGGPGTPGLLIIKRRLITNPLPSTIGGGTVSFVTPTQHTYLPVGERREEGGTPGIVEAIRAGLIFKLKAAIGASRIEALEDQWVAKIESRWRHHPQIDILGADTDKRISITSIRLKTVQGYLHHGFVVALLNDVFGIQMRGGCSCAGPYGHQLLSIDAATSLQIEAAVTQGHKLLKPGWVRFNLNYFISEAEADFILDAVEFVAQHGLTLLPYYQYDEQADLWLFQGKRPPASTLEGIFNAPNISTDKLSASQKSTLWQQYLAEAEALVTGTALAEYHHCQQNFDPKMDKFRQFVLQQDLPA